MKVAGLQLGITWESPEENFARVRSHAEGAARAGARLLALPEMFATGFTMKAEEAAGHAGATRELLAEVARGHGLWVVGGFVDPGEPRPLNAAAVFDPAGREVLLYHKLHPFSLAHEDEHYGAGETLPTVEVEGLSVTPLVCYDLRFPEPFRAAATRTDLFVVIANWPEPRSAAWRTLLCARAIENQAWVLGVNRVGDDPNGHHYRGDTSLHDPMGLRVASACEQEAMVTGDVSAEAVARVRSKLSFLSDRRPATYRSLEVD